MAKAKNSSVSRERLQAGRQRFNVTAEIDRRRPDEPVSYIDRLLDDALEQTFPASDAVAVVLTRRR
jgi:hypothetical protein